MKTAKRFAFLLLLPAALVLSSPGLAQAHPGLSAADGLWNGFAHPLGGLDHLCAMLGVGLWAAQRGGRAIWFMPLAFLVVMAIGGVLGMLAVHLPWIEPGILASVLILALLIAAAVRLPLAASVLTVGVLGIFHGHAHGTEMPQTASGLMYGVGFLTATAMLHFSGVGIGICARHRNAEWGVRCAGMILLCVGIYMLLPS